MRKVGILVFDDAEVLDFAGPFEVFSSARDQEGNALFDVTILAQHDAIIKARNDFLVKPNDTIEDHPALDVLLVPGGKGTRKEMHNERLKVWINRQAEQVELLLSVCTGSLVLGVCGLLDNLSATTHHGAFDELAEAAPNTKVIRDQKYVDNGSVITSAGISAGIEMSLHVVAKLHGKDIAVKTAKYMEYDWEE